MDSIRMPVQTRFFIVLTILTFIYGIGHFLAFDASIYTGYLKNNFLIFYALVLGLYLLAGFVIFKIYKARAWARLLWTVYFVINYDMNLHAAFDYTKYHVAIAVLNSLDLIVKNIALVLLWHPATNRWLKTAKASGLKLSDTDGNQTDDFRHSMDAHQPGTDPTTDCEKDAAESIPIRLRKALRVFRSLYSLSVIFISLNIVVIYGVIIHETLKPVTAQKTGTFISMHYSISGALLILLFISAGYIIVEYLCDKRLRTYPDNHTNQRYSKLSSLISAFAHLFFAFLLNNFIVCFFLISKTIIYNCINLFLLNMVAIIFVYLILIKRFTDKKMSVNYGVAAALLSVAMIIFSGLFERFFFHIGMPLFIKAAGFIIYILASFKKMILI